ncbi:GGDEF domain-containing protein [Solirubrobacter taibaiensis]|nr:GGDEF domain-containing protein [Solirubrobacter taibaiensis]
MRSENDGRVEDALARTKESDRQDARDRATQSSDQTAADLDHTHAEVDQAASDADQAASDSDQALADRDQHASDRDQAAADWEHAHTATPNVTREAHETSRAEREAGTKERARTSEARAHISVDRTATAKRRDEAARTRDLVAAARDRVGAARDATADARDRAAEIRERQSLAAGIGDDIIAPLRALRISGAVVRKRAAQERAAAAADRDAAATDRERAAEDRDSAGLDELTGVFRRGTGELALTHEIARARRMRQGLILVVLDVDALKAVNDTRGHVAGDALLRSVGTAITSTMRGYDLTVRWGGDEFVCALSDVTAEVAAERVAEIQRTLASLRAGASISAGLAELDRDDTLESLVARADVALYQVKASRARSM